MWAKYILNMSGALVVGTLLYFLLYYNWGEKDKTSSGNSAEINRHGALDARSDPLLTSDQHASAIPDPGTITSGKPISLFPRKRESVVIRKSPMGPPEEMSVLPESVLQETRDRASDVSKITIEADGKNLTPEQRRKIEGLIGERDKMLDELRKANLGESEKVAKRKEVNDGINGKIQSVLTGEEE